MSVLPAEDCPLAQATGRVLRTPIAADRDLPPYDRVTMDGYAIRLGNGSGAAAGRVFRVAGVQAAGMIPLTLASDDACVEVATGAMLPAGADTIVPCEDTVRDGEEKQNEPRATGAAPEARYMRLAGDCAPVRGQFVHRRGSDHAAGAAIVPAGARLGPREIAVAAACGCAHVRVSMQPRVAVVATGDELVEVAHPSPAPHQTRRSNEYALRAALLAAGCARVDCEHLRDVEHEMESRLKAIIAGHDAVLITGGVSKGRFDFIPAVLAKLGVEKKFHGVAQRPGKPLWFGMSQRGTPVFALPGNPVSACVCLSMHVLPALESMMGLPPAQARHAALAEPFAQKSPLAVFVPARIGEERDGRRIARLLPANTSGDLAALTGTDGFVEFPPGPREHAAGEAVRFHPW